MIGSPAHPAGHESSVPGWCTSRPHATMQSNALARERRPPVGTARRRRAAGRTPTSGVVRLSAGTPAFSVIRTGAWYTPFAALRAAVPAPTGRTGQRSAQFSRWGLPCQRCHLDGWHSSGAAFSQQLAPVFRPASPADRATKPSRDGARAMVNSRRAMVRLAGARCVCESSPGARSGSRMSAGRPPSRSKTIRCGTLTSVGSRPRLRARRHRPVRGRRRRVRSRGLSP